MRLLTTVVVLLILSACANSNKMAHVKLEILSGTVIAQPLQDWPTDTELHVFLQENLDGKNAGKIISSQHIALKLRQQEIPFAIEYTPSDTQQDAGYSVQACITSSGNVVYTSERDVPVSTHDLEKPLVIRMGGIEKVAGVGSLNADAETTLQRGIQAALIDICRQKPGFYDYLTRTRASLILPPELQEGPHHKVREQVDLHGPHYFFIVDSDYGVFTAQSLPLLKTLVHEFNAIAELRKITRSEEYFKITKESGLIPFVEVKELLWNPVDTVSGIPKGLLTFFNTLPTSLTGGRSDYEDSYLAALITVSKYKRRYAAELGVDVYSDNLMLQYELDRLCWAAALGNWTPSIVLLPFSGAGKAAYSAFGLTETLNRALIEEAPDVLRYESNLALKKMGVTKELRKQFLGHQHYSPRMFTIIAAALGKLENVQGRDKFFQEAVLADSVIDAFTFQQIAELLLEYHLAISPLSEIVLYKEIPVAYTMDKTLVIAFPADIFRWTPFSERIATDIDAELSSELDIKNKTVRIPGRLTVRARRNLDELAIDYTGQGEIMPY